MTQRPILFFLVAFLLSFVWVPIGKGQSLDQHTRDLLRLFQYELNDIYDRYGGHNSRVTGEPWPEIIPSDDEIEDARRDYKIELKKLRQELEKRYGKERYKLLEKAREAKDNAIARLWAKYREKGLMKKLERQGFSLEEKFLHLAEPGKDVFIEDQATKKEIPLRDFIKSLPPEPPPKAGKPPPSTGSGRPPRSQPGRSFLPRLDRWRPKGGGGNWLFYLQDMFNFWKNTKANKLRELKEEMDYLKRQVEQYEQAVNDVEQEIFVKQDLQALEKAGLGPQGTNVAELKKTRNELLIKMEQRRERRYDLGKQARQLEDELRDYHPQSPEEQLGIDLFQRK